MAYHCGVEVTAEIIGGKWTPVILAHLKEGRRRYAELRRLVPGITEKMLTQRLRELADHGIVERIQVATTPPHVEYDLTPTGRSLAPVLQSMWDWGEERARQENLIIDRLS
jgi:DNA-binding HxlR family transcriptional regulator